MDHTTSHPLVPDVGSFSYSWPTSTPEPQPEERIGHGDITACSGTDAASSASRYSFAFRLSVSEQAEAMADADEVFLNGLLLPLQLASHQGEEDARKAPVLARSLSLDSSQRMVASAAASRRHWLPRPASASKNSSPCSLRGGRAVTPERGAVFRTSKLRLPSFGRCGRRRHKWMSFRFLVPLCQKIVGCIWRREAMEKATDDASHRAEYGSDKVKLSDAGQENDIRDAILHCKRSL